MESDFSDELVFQIGRSPCNLVVSDLVQVYDGAAKPVAVTTTPPGLAVNVTYDGLSDPPTAAGTYRIAATVTDSNYFGVATATLVIEKTNAGILLQDLDQNYSGTPTQVRAITSPPGLAVILTYNRSTDLPVDVGSYEVTASIDDPNYFGGSIATLIIHKADIQIHLGNLNQVYACAKFKTTMMI
jgi:hypothetical protein